MGGASCLYRCPTRVPGRASIKLVPPPPLLLLLSSWANDYFNDIILNVTKLFFSIKEYLLSEGTSVLEGLSEVASRWAGLRAFIDALPGSLAGHL